MSSHLSDTGMLHIQTLLHPNQTDHTILDSWYICTEKWAFFYIYFCFNFYFVQISWYQCNEFSIWFGGFKNKPLFKNNIFV